MSKIRLAIAGLCNCASSLIQGIEYYRKHPAEHTGILFEDIGGYKVTDIEIVAAFDVTLGKVGEDISKAIFASPNNTEKISDVPELGTKVQMGPILDGVPEHLRKFMEVSEHEPVDVGNALKEVKADVFSSI